MTVTVNNKVNPYYAKVNHIRLAREDVCKAELTIGGGGGPVVESIFSDIPAAFSNEPGTIYTLGVCFRCLVPGRLTHIRFYQPVGDPLTSRDFALYESGNPVSLVVQTAAVVGPGWTEGALDAPVDLTTGTVYIAAVYVPDGNYGYTAHMFDTAVISGNLVAVADAEAPNGRYHVGGFGIPTDSFNATWYGVDIKFEAA